MTARPGNIGVDLADDKSPLYLAVEMVGDDRILARPLAGGDVRTIPAGDFWPLIDRLNTGA